MSKADDELMARYHAAGQGQVFHFWAELDGPQRARLAAQAAEIDLAEIARLHRELVQTKAGAGMDFARLQPPPVERLPEHGGDAALWARARARGEEALRAGQVAAFTVAGGQGTRLGYDGPKGTFAVTPVKGKSLFQVFAEKILAAGRRHGKPLHWFIMTSHANHGQTEEFFRANRCFGLDAGRVHFLRQGRMPAVDFSGKILLEGKAEIALSPDGHGGSLRALLRSGALDLMKTEGVTTLSYFQVDNPLVRCVDPAFIGFHLLRESEMSSKMVPKAYPEEKVGHFARYDGRLCVVEYSDLPMERQRERLPDGRLRFEAGNIAVHLLDREFVRRLAAGGPGAELPFHRADKKIPCLDEAGNPLRPVKPNGVKFEMFVFDAIPHARNALVVETARADDFSPVKNADGVDSPRTAREDQLRQFARWLRAAGADVPVDASGLPHTALEISPLFGDDAATVTAAWRKLRPAPAITPGLYLNLP
jgi:UDP-N-acetylglucosamine/UDP-N-acetylgalactosamine diphosphorylase